MAVAPVRRVVAMMTVSVSVIARRRRRRSNPGESSGHAADGRSERGTVAAARGSADRRSGTRPHQAATDGALRRVVRVRARRQAHQHQTESQQPKQSAHFSPVQSRKARSC